MRGWRCERTGGRSGKEKMQVDEESGVRERKEEEE